MHYHFVKNFYMPKKHYGQNFLIDESISDKIVGLEDINNNNILEIGPGNLALTKRILDKKPKNFCAVEIDRDLINKYQKSYLSKNIIHFDALKFNERSFFKNKKFKIISNLPFNISTKLLIKWIKIKNEYNCIDSMTLMFQKELAERIIANKNSKKYGRITILVNAFFSIEKKLFIKKNNFFPIPKVDAIVLKFSSLKKNKIKKQNLSKLEEITTLFFNERRKKNANKIKKLFNEKIIKKYNLEKYYTCRPEDLDKNIYYMFSDLL